jgi:hypothetical protein
LLTLLSGSDHAPTVPCTVVVDAPSDAAVRHEHGNDDITIGPA